MALHDDPGFAFSGFTHVALLGAALVSFSSAPKLEDAQESVPVEMLTTDQFNKITKGDKSAEKPMPRPRVDKLAQVQDAKPLPPVAEAKQDVPSPPPPLKRQPDPGQADTPEKVADAPTPPPRPVAEPPKPAPRPEPAKVAAERPEPEDAEPMRPKPPPRPKLEQAKVEPKPEPPKKVEPPKKPESTFKPDQLAKLLAQQPVDKPAARPKSGDETAEPRRFNLADISQLLSKDIPQRRAASGRELQQVASLGAPTASAAQMAPSLWAALDGYMQDQYKQCWTYLGLGAHQKYVPEIRVQYAQDGGLLGSPALMNPPSDPNLRSLADSALRAVRKCDPMKIPAQFLPYYEQWKGRIVRFDPETML